MKGKKKVFYCKIHLSSDHSKVYNCPLISKIVKLPKSLQRIKKVKSLRKYHFNSKKVSNFFSLDQNTLIFQDENGAIIGTKEFQPENNYFVSGEEINRDEGSLVNGNLKTGIIYNEAMEKHFDRNSNIKEIPNRIIRIRKYLKSKNILSLENCIEMESRKATSKELELCHDAKYIEEVMNNKIKNGDDWYFNPEGTSEAALHACGSILTAVDSIFNEKKIDNAFVCSRPPSHHALRDKPMGFCFFSNVAIAAKYAKEKYGLNKVLIVDWDVHHGNGTQELRKDEKDILYISVHRNFYPFTGTTNAIGKKGNTINICFDESYGDSEMMNAFHQIILPASIEFNPDLILVCAGFDAVERDLLGKCNVKPKTYGILTNLLMSICGGKNLIVCLEGGYNLSQLEICVFECVKVLLGNQPKNLSINKKISKGNSRCIAEALKIQSQFFDCFRIFKDLEIEEKVKKKLEKDD